MDSSSSDETGSEDMSKSLNPSNTRRSPRASLSKGERSKKPLEDSEDSTDDQKHLSTSSWQHPNLGATQSMYLKDDIPDSASRMSFDYDDDDSDVDDQEEPNSILDGPFGLGNVNICWPPPGVENTINNESDKKSKGDKKKKHGIIYLSSIPIGYNVSRTTGFFSQFGRVGRVFLQPDLKEKNKRKDKLARNFSEGWIEFISKRVAKDVASNLNMTQVGGKKRSKSHDVIWNIKYLPGFKWTNLSERLAYENAVQQQRMRTEISQAKRETDQFRANVERSKRFNIDKTGDNSEQLLPLAKKSRKTVSHLQANLSKRMYEFRQKETDEAIRKRKGVEHHKSLENELKSKPDIDPIVKSVIPTEKLNKPKKSLKAQDKCKKEFIALPTATKTFRVENKKSATSPTKEFKQKPGKPTLDNSMSNAKSLSKESKMGVKADLGKARNASGAKRKESSGNNDRTDFLKNVFL